MNLAALQGVKKNLAKHGFHSPFFVKVMSTLSLFFQSESMLPDGLNEVVWGGGEECVQYLLSEEKPASTELPEADALAAINFRDL